MAWNDVLFSLAIFSNASDTARCFSLVGDWEASEFRSLSCLCSADNSWPLPKADQGMIAMPWSSHIGIISPSISRYEAFHLPW